MPNITGSCLCESVRYEVAADFHKLNICHCKQCQRATGSAHASNLFISPDSFRWTKGEERVKRFDVAGRSISNAFCIDCGSTLPFQSKASNNMVVPAGTLDDPPGHVASVANIFWPERAAWYDAAIEAERFDEFAEP